METAIGVHSRANADVRDGGAARPGRRVIDLAGRRFGRLAVVRDTGRRVGNNVVWLCRCDCGGEHEAQASQLKRGAVRSCGCHRRRDISGQRFGRLVALRPTGARRSGRAVWLCACDCGREHETALDYLLAGSTRSCGCLRRDVASEQMRRIRAQVTVTLDPEASALARRHAAGAGVPEAEVVRRALVALGELPVDGGAGEPPAAGAAEPGGSESATRTEVRDGRVFTVTVLPDAVPHPRRSARSHYRFEDVGKGGSSYVPGKRWRNTQPGYVPFKERTGL